jgi:hypothetical protein
MSDRQTLLIHFPKVCLNRFGIFKETLQTDALFFVDLSFSFYLVFIWFQFKDETKFKNTLFYVNREQLFSFNCNKSSTF